MINPRHQPRKLRYLRFVVEVCLFLGATGCALLGSGNISVPRATHYRVTAPHDWKPLDSSESDHAYQLPSGNIATLNSSCNSASHHPLTYLSQDLILGARDVDYQQRKPLTVDGTEGLYSALTLTMNKAPFHMRIFVMAKQGCVFDFSLLSPRPIPATETEEFLAFVKSFKYGKN